jgi:hypothetical protein
VGSKSMAAVTPLQVLRQHVRKHWTREAPDCASPIIEDSEKATVRATLPAGLSDPNSKLRTAVGLAVAAIAKWDCPEEWPDLLDNLLRAINQHDNPHLSGSHRLASSPANTLTMHHSRPGTLVLDNDVDTLRIVLQCTARCSALRCSQTS